MVSLLEKVIEAERPNGVLEGLRRRSRTDVRFSDWLEENLVMPAMGNKRAGPLRLEDWQREPADALLDPDCRAAVFMWNAQSLKSTLAMGRIGYSILERQDMPLLIGSTQDVLKRFVQHKIDPLLQSFPRLSAELKRNRNLSVYFEDGLYSVRRGKVTQFDTSRSDSGMKSVSSNLVAVEEYDDFAGDNTESSSPFEMLMGRGAQMIDPLLILPGTPKMKGYSYIDDAFNRSDARERYVVCVHCGQPIMLEFGEHVIKDNAGVWHFYCVSCGQEITEEEKCWMITDAGGAYWEATNLKATSSFWGWHITQFHSQIHSIQDVMEFYEPDAPSGFMTQRMARAFTNEESPPLEEEELMELHRPFPDGSPFCRVVTVDSQYGKEARYEASLVDWYGDFTDPIPCVVEHVIIAVGNEDNEDWDKATQALRDYSRDKSADITFIDVGSNEGGDKIKNLIRKNWRRGMERGEVRCIKGQGIADSQKWPTTTVIAKDRHYNDDKPYDETLSIYTDVLKLWVIKSDLHNKKVRLNPDKSRFPEGYYKQLAAEWLERYVSGAVEKTRWRKKPRQRNEALDCLVYAYAAMIYLGANYIRRGARKVDQKFLDWALKRNKNDDEVRGRSDIEEAEGGAG